MFVAKDGQKYTSVIVIVIFFAASVIDLQHHITLAQSSDHVVVRDTDNMLPLTKVCEQ